MGSRLEILKDINVFVYSGGKTGSTTLHTTLEKHALKSMHVHSNSHFQKFILRSSTTSLHEFIHKASTLHDKIYIIDIYRNPIERNISSFFHNLSQHLPKKNARYSVPNLVEYYNTNHMYTLENYYPVFDILQEFNLELPSSFDFEKEYITLHHKNITILLLRFSSIGKWDSILSEIFGTPIKLINDNLTEHKWYSKVYKKFLQIYKPSDLFLQEVTEHPLFKFFNTKEEQEVYKQKWMSESTESQPLSADRTSCTQTA